LSSSELFERYPGNPILTAAQWPYTVNAVFNPGVTRVGTETLLLARVEDRTGRSHLSIARSADGLEGWTIEPAQRLLPNESEDERYGIEDPRITLFGDEYMILYTGYSSSGPLVRLASTRDFETFDRRGTLMPPEDKDAALFPYTFDGRYALIHRPVTATPRQMAHIWLSWSPDLHFWGDHTVLLPARDGGWWDANKIGLGPPPLETERGWLMLYHGVRTTVAGALYRLGLALLDRDNPARVLARSSEWIFGPQAPYELSGDVPAVVFPCGWTLDDDGDTVRLYYGASDTTICVATGSLASLLNWLERHSS
jgi:beta-1,4-mannooligosaccharide/beta-1,4-mannosyl-N-acetylglucosamine phosphorylase